MKKLLLLGLFSLSVSFLQAQSARDVRLQLGADYNFYVEAFGLNFGGEYLITDQVSVAPNYSIYFPERGNASNLNIDARYYFTKDILQWYGLVGFSNNWISFSDDIFGDVKSSNAGANIGVGGVLKFTDSFAFNPEFKYQAQKHGQTVFRFALVYFINHK
ncbi:outer membrane beta-barrel protein [Echinicola sp. CAU 1574]|uniref:Outer membrane beta-barrel protein n=1 Tax=Echinicola arenosa TaxID=2774144 RepID=A0ABR9AKU5_9BACT|nr:outer membrane beta-barrel protein [Echinicola arenosa]MBD8488448.1 outer membrane beta-barrel protein [Echinicola arenosa]